MPKSQKEHIEIGYSQQALKPKTSILDPFRALKHRSLSVLGIVAALYNFGFFTIMA